MRREQIASLREREDTIRRLLQEVRERLHHIRVDPTEKGPYRGQNAEGDAAEQRALLREEAALMRERERIRRELADIGIHHGLPLLAQVTLASPCPASWEEMLGTGNVRFCKQCSKHVYDMTSLTQQEAEELLVRHEGKLCGQVYLRNDGTILTADCWVGKKRVVTLALCAAGVASALAVGALTYDSLPIPTALVADSPCVVQRDDASSGVMVAIHAKAPTANAVCAAAPPEQAQNTRIVRVPGGLRMLPPRHND